MENDPKQPKDIKKLFEVWISSDMKCQVLVFFHNNPGVVETLEGLAKRMGVSVEALEKEISDHVTLGLLKERQVDHKKVLIYNKEKESEIERFIIDALGKNSTVKR
ncbi:MAG: hypothetical protein PHH26_04465 [Candidatus Thermoplasmatota archaeon]|nr:hypothetical protein [Candidatus Thermoplasmatota archaeon]